MIEEKTEAGVLSELNTLPVVVSKIETVIVNLTPPTLFRGELGLQRVLTVLNTLHEFFDLSILDWQISAILFEKQVSWKRELAKLTSQNIGSVDCSIKKLEKKGIAQEVANDYLKGHLRTHVVREVGGLGNFGKMNFFVLTEKAFGAFSAIEAEVVEKIPEKAKPTVKHFKNGLEQTQQLILPKPEPKTEKTLFNLTKRINESTGRRCPICKERTESARTKFVLWKVDETHEQMLKVCEDCIVKFPEKVIKNFSEANKIDA